MEAYDLATWHFYIDFGIYFLIHALPRRDITLALRMSYNSVYNPQKIISFDNRRLIKLRYLFENSKQFQW